MSTRLISAILTFALIISFTSMAMAVPPTEEVIQKLKDEGRFDSFVESMARARAAGVNSVPYGADKDERSVTLSPNQTLRVLVILVDFPGKSYTGGWASGTVGDFDSLLFSDGINPTGSMKEYYFENSYGNLTLVGDVYGWYTSSQNSTYYTNYCDGSHGMGSYPNNAQKLVEEAVDAADNDVDYSMYDNDGDGYVDGLFVVHAGTGYEESGSDCEIHSHAWGINPRMMDDGVRVSSYSTEPEESPMDGLISIGVFCHEFGHTLGLPDLYDTDYTSRGIGRWGLMASGSHNGNSRTPAQFCAWSKKELGWLTPINIASNQTDVELPAVEWNPIAYRMWRNGTVGNEYFLIENRQLMGFDAEIPSSGILIWHIDENQWGNTNDWHPLVMLEQADGKFDLQYGRNSGDGGDPFPSGGAYPHFHDKTTPDSRDYSNLITQTAVWDISASDSLMTADFDIYWSRPYLTLTEYIFDDATYGDGDGFLDEGETIELTFTVQNDWLDATAATATLSIDDAMLIVGNGTTSLGTIAGSSTANNNGDPLTFDVPVGYNPRIDSFFIEISSNGGAHTTILPIEQNVGVPRVLLVDDDNNDTLDAYYAEPFLTKRSPYGYWDKYSSGSPSISDLSDYEAVFWFTGDLRSFPLTGADITALSDYMDAGGKLFISGQGIANQLSTADPTFLADYLKSSYLQTLMIPLLVPESGGQVLAGLDSIAIGGAGGAANQSGPDWITPVNGGMGELHYHNATDMGAVSYDGLYKLIFFAFGFEAIPRDDGRWEERDSVFNRVMDFLGLTEVSEFPSLSELNIGPGDQMNLTDHNPDIDWTYFDEGGRPQLEYTIEVGTDADWTMAEMWNTGTVSGAETTVPYGGATLVDGQMYYFRVQSFNGIQWSNWENGQFRMNSIPSVPTGPTPDNMSGVASATPDLEHQNSSDGEGDQLTYAYEVYDDELLTSLVTSDDGIIEGSGTTVWTVNATLGDEGQYYWRVRAYDGYEYGDWSAAASFWVNSVNQPPPVFNLNSPEDGVLMIDFLPSFHWGPSSGGGDLFDGVTYTFMYDTNSNFTRLTSVAGLTDTTYQLTDSIELGNIYFWKVEAHDYFGGVTPSAEVFSFATWVPGDANGDRTVNVGDAVHLINYVFKGGDAPNPLASGDANGDCAVNVGDAVSLINYVFKDGDPPIVNDLCTWP